MRNYLHVVLLIVCIAPFARAAEDIKPSISPTFFTASTQITVTYDVTGTPLAALSEAYIWVWIPGKGIDAKYNVNPATSAQAAAKFTRTGNLFSITFKPSDFFSQSIGAETSMGMLLKGTDFNNGQTSDYIVNFWDGSFQVQLTSPLRLPLFVNDNESFDIEAITPVAADFELFINDISVDTKSNLTTYTYSRLVSGESGNVKLVANEVGNPLVSDNVEFQYILSVSSPEVSRPAGIIAGINYNQSDATRVTLCLWAPLKSSVYAVGDFNDWVVSPDYLMNRDGEHFWIELYGLTPGEEYGFQYLVDESIRVGDPYADKILDPNDQYIPASTYPDLKPFPAKAISNKSYENRVAVFQTAQVSYEWQVTDFVKPAKEKLVVYELLIRDFFDEDNRNYQNLIDTIQYFKRLGVNAIELMPIMEFNGNEGWGYNPTFMFAPDKYYGTKNKLKEFVDVCHQNGIAVILDIAMNHQDIPNPYALMYFEFGADGTYGKPTAENPWFNRNPTHPFNVFYDMNHASAYTKAYLDTVNHYWLNEYKVDGFRFDLSKGFTQSNHPDDVGAWSAYDASRVELLKRMADKIWSHIPDGIIILEHLGENNEERELGQYRSGEGKGMMLWGNLNYAYNQNTMGYSDGSDVSWVHHKTRGWSVPHVVGYMESHDEERLMYKNLQYGNASGNYNVKSEEIGLHRIRAAGLMFYTIPGPKMLWQFGELGYDKSINTCENGTVNPPGAEGGDGDCRLAIKPLPWSYQNDYSRDGLFKHTADLLRLRNTYDVFTGGEAIISRNGGLLQQLTLKNVPYTASPTNTDDMNVQVAVNFDVVTQSAQVTFPHAGIWYDYYNHGRPLEVTATPFTIELTAGAYKLFTDVEITNPLVTAVIKESTDIVSIYPNPVQRELRLESNSSVADLKFYTVQGTAVYPNKISESTWDTTLLPNGVYVVEVRTTDGFHRLKLIKN